MSGRNIALKGLVLAGLAAAAAFSVPSAEARTRGFVGLSVGLPAYAYGPPVYYAPPPVYYAAPPVYYAPRPVYVPPPAYSPAPTYAAPAPSSSECREYSSNTTIDGQLRTVTGTACLQSDGTWRIVR